jgi:hypothetical protein
MHPWIWHFSIVTHNANSQIPIIMHVTSNYYRGTESLPAAQDPILKRSGHTVSNTSKSIQAEPLRPSDRTMRRLARHYKDSHSPKYSA